MSVVVKPNPDIAAIPALGKATASVKPKIIADLKFIVLLRLKS
jgi:hypothetical protein